MNENQLLQQVIALARDHGVLIHHCYDSRKCQGKGFPDLILVGKNTILYVELKDDSNQLSTSQIAWKYLIVAAGGRFEVWRPGDLDLIEQVMVTL